MLNKILTRPVQLPDESRKAISTVNFLSRLPALILEQIVRKLDGVSYFRLQQTCRVMRNLIHDNHRIKYTARLCELREDGHFYWLNWEKVTDISSLNRIHFRQFKIRRNVKDATEFEEIRDHLQRYHITADFVEYGEMSFFLSEYRGRKMTGRECLELLKVLNPDRIELYSQASSRYQALFNLNEEENRKFVKEVTVYLSSTDVLSATPRLLAKFQRVAVGTGVHWDILINLLTSLLEIFRFEGMSMCEDFVFDTRLRNPSLFDDDLVNLVQQFNPIIVSQGDTECHLNFSFWHKDNTTIFCDVQIYQKRLHLRCTKTNPNLLNRDLL